MSSENGNRAALRKARLISSMAALWGRRALLGNLNLGLLTSNVNGPDVDGTPVNVNDPNVDGTPMNVNGPGVDGIPVNVNGADVDGNQTDWTLPHSDFPHYEISLLGRLGSFSGAYPLLLTPNLSPIYVTAQVLRLSCQIARALKHPTLSDRFDMTPPQGRTALPPYALYLRASSASFPAT